MNFIAVTFLTKNGNEERKGIKRIDELDAVIQEHEFTNILDKDGSSCRVKEKSRHIINMIKIAGFNVIEKVTGE